MNENLCTDSDKHICKICGYTTSALGMPAHLKHKHHLTVKDYYDMYIKQADEGKCLICGKDTAFCGLNKKYNLYCSLDCANSSSLRKQHIAETNLKRYGTTCSLASEEVRKKVKQTNINKFGVENAFSSDIIKNKIKQTNLDRYGETSPAKCEFIKEKMKQTSIERYGVEYTFQSKEMREKSKQTCIKKYGVDHPWKSSQLKQKQIEDFCTLNNLIPLSELNLYAPNKVLAKFSITPIEYMTRYFIDANIDTDKLIEYSNKLLSNRGTIIERELDIWLSDLGVKHAMRDFSIISPLQLDCYIPDKKVAIEIDGVYWHSYNHTKDKNKQLNKTNKCLEKGIRLIHITDLEWTNKNDICKSIILSALGMSSNIIYARKCEIRPVDKNIAKDFVNNNHIDGHINAEFYQGLFYKNELVQIITIGKSRFKKNEYELLRMCTKLNTQVIGGFSKLMCHQPYNELISYVDRSKFTGNSYIKAGFTLINTTKPNYNYYIGNTQISRISAQKHKLPKLLGDKFDSNKTESENMMNAGYLMLYDCGNYKMLYKKGI